MARSLLVAGRARVGWWALVPDRMGRRKPVSTIPSPPPLLHAPPRARPSPRPLFKRPRAAYLQMSTRVWWYKEKEGQWDAVCPSASPTQLGVAANEKRRPRDACRVTAAWSPKVSVVLANWSRLASLHVEVGRELDLHRLDMVVADIKPRSFERRELECASRMLAARV